MQGKIIGQVNPISHKIVQYVCKVNIVFLGDFFSLRVGTTWKGFLSRESNRRIKQLSDFFKSCEKHGGSAFLREKMIHFSLNSVSVKL